MAQVVRKEVEYLRVHFQGLHSRFDEDIRLESSKVSRGIMEMLYLTFVEVVYGL